MHPVLEIPELFTLILQHQPEKNVLLQIALTCTTLKEAVLDELWADLDSIVPLLQLLSPLVKVSNQWVCSDCCMASCGYLY